MKLLALLLMAADPSGQSQPDVELLDFTAGYCQPCQQMIPRLQRMERDGFPVRRIDITKNPEITRQHNVERIPTLIVLVEGKEYKRFVGLTDESELRQVMNDSARKLDLARRDTEQAAPPELQTAELRPGDSPPAEPTTDSAPPEEPRKKGLRDLFAQIRKGLTGADADASRFEHPTFRGQSPDATATGEDAVTRPMQATVRITVSDGRVQDFGTGTIVHSVAGRSVILTCAHLFHSVKADAVTKVELFQNGQSLTYAAKVLGGDKDSDLAFLQIDTASPLPVCPLISADRKVLEGDAVFSIGCSGGQLPTMMQMKIVSLNRYMGPANIVCTRIPEQGRSGGGLFNSAGELVGVCSAADQQQNEGLYMAADAVRKLIAELQLQSLFEQTTPAAVEPESQYVSAETRGAIPEFEEFTDEDLINDLFEEKPQTQQQQGQSHAPDHAIYPLDTTPGLTRLSQGPSPQATSVNNGPAATAQEITVIIDSRDPSRPKQVIVIPRPSPWLVQILSGEGTAQAPAMATARNANLPAAGSQVAVRKPLPATPFAPVTR